MIKIPLIECLESEGSRKIAVCHTATLKERMKDAELIGYFASAEAAVFNFGVLTFRTSRPL